MLNKYGATETNSIADAAYDSNAVDYSEGLVPLSDSRLVSIDRVRLLTEPGYPAFDISYVWGTLADGRHVRVDLGVERLARKNLKGQFLALAKEQGVYAKRLGLLNEEVLSILRG